MATATTPAKMTAKAKKPKTKPTPTAPITLESIERQARVDAGLAWRKLVAEYQRPHRVGRDSGWRQARFVEGLARLRSLLNREPTDVERATYLSEWADVIFWRASQSEDENEPGRAVIRYILPSRPAELANVLRHFLLDEFDSAPMGGRLVNGADFEIGIDETEMTVAVLSQHVWWKVADLVNAAIKDEMSD